MRIVDIREQAVSLRSDIRNAWISFAEMDTSIVSVITDSKRDGARIVGFGFNSNGRYSVGDLLRRRMIPRLLQADPAELVDESGANLDPHRCWDTMMQNEKPGGHGERAQAVAAVDMAIWDAVAKIECKPLARVLAERYGSKEPESDVFVYAAGGYYYPGKDNRELQDEMRGYLELGYTVVKMKIGGAPLSDDLHRLEAVIEIVGDGSRVAVDANGRFDLPTALEYARALEPYRLFWYEEPGYPLDYELQSQLADAYPNALATGENLFSVYDARNLLRYGGMRPDRDWIQVDPALSYGCVEYLRLLTALEQFGWSSGRCMPHGGHQFALHMAAGLKLGGNESYPGVFAPIGGFADGASVVDGRVAWTDEPGIGIERKAELYRAFQALAA